MKVALVQLALLGHIQFANAEEVRGRACDTIYFDPPNMAGDDFVVNWESKTDEEEHFRASRYTVYNSRKDDCDEGTKCSFTTNGQTCQKCYYEADYH